MKIPRLLGVNLFALAALAGFAGCKGEDGPPSADVAAWVKDASTVQVSVIVPPGHHAYLDKGVEGNYIPVSVDTSGVGDLRLKDSPPGELDKEVRAKVLRGMGAFLYETKDASAAAGKSLRVRSQICDERKGVCYAPRTVEVKISGRS